MKGHLLLGLMAMLLVPSLAFAQSSTKTIEFPITNNTQTLEVGNSLSFYKNINVSNWQELHEYWIVYFGETGVSDINFSVNNNFCRKVSVFAGFSQENPVICTNQLTANLSNTVMNLTIVNLGSQQVNFSLTHKFTVDENASIEVYPLSQAQLDQMEADINASIKNANSSIWTRIGLVVTDIFNKIMTNGQTYQSFIENHDTNQTSQHNSINVTINSSSNLTASDVWNYILSNAETAQANVVEIFRWRWSGLANANR